MGCRAVLCRPVSIGLFYHRCTGNGIAIVQQIVCWFYRIRHVATALGIRVPEAVFDELFPVGADDLYFAVEGYGDFFLVDVSFVQHFLEGCPDGVLGYLVVVCHGFHGLQEGGVDVLAGDVVEVLQDHVIVSPGEFCRVGVFYVLCGGGF